MAQLILYGGYDFEPTIINPVQATKTQPPKWQWMSKPFPNRSWAKNMNTTQEEHESGEMAPIPMFGTMLRMVRMAAVIRDQLAKLSPENADLYTRNAQQLTDELKQVDTWIEAQIDTIPPSNVLVTTHDALGYYANAYGLKIEGAAGL